MDRCPYGWFGAHKFRPRYSLGASKWMPGGYIGFKASEHVESYRDKTYVCDVCEKCGATISPSHSETP